jgi:hypothetical protein
MPRSSGILVRDNFLIFYQSTVNIGKIRYDEVIMISILQL